MANIRRLVELGLAPLLAKEVAAAIDAGSVSANSLRRLTELGMVPRQIRELRSQLATPAMRSAKRWTEIGFAPRLAVELVTQVGGGGGGGGGAVFSMTQLASANRIYQRSTTNDGGQAKGRGIVPVPLASVTTPGPVYARTRSVSDGTVLQASWAAATLSTTGPQTVQVANVDARLGWFFLDLSVDGTTWQNGTVPIGMGRLVAMSGQSQMVRQFGKMSTYAGTNASLGVTVNPNTSVYGRYTDTSRSNETPAWSVPADATAYDSTFASEFLRLQVSTFGVNTGMVGHSVGSTAIATWQPGQANFVNLAAVLDAVGGFEAFYEHLGGDDAGANTTAANFSAGLTGLFGGLAARNAARGSNFNRFVTTMATRTSGASGTVASVTTIRTAARDWAAANNAVYLEPHDITLEDSVHQGQAGNIVLARHVHRAMASSDAGPIIASATRAAGSANVVLKLTLVGSSPLVAIGAPGPRFSVFPAGSTTGALALDATTPFALSGSPVDTITLKLAVVPADTAALDVYALLHPDPSGTTAFDNMVYDSRVEDGLPRGRQIMPSLTPIVAPAPGTPSVGNMNATFTAADNTPITSYTTESGHTFTQPSGTHIIFNNEVTGTAIGNAVSTFANTNPVHVVTAELRYIGDVGSELIQIRYQDESNFCFFGFGSGGNWIVGRTKGGAVVATSVVPNPALVSGQTYTLECSASDTGVLTLKVNGTQVGTANVPSTDIPLTGRVGIRKSATAGTTTTGCHYTSLTATGA